MRDASLPPSFRQFLHEFDEDEQTALIRWGADALQACGAPRIRAFRAGSFGANADTLKALVRNGIRMDSSYDPAFAGVQCKLPVDRLQLQAWQFDGLLEFPVSAFEDYPGHLRHAQICACSLAEMTHALNLACSTVGINSPFYCTVSSSSVIGWRKTRSCNLTGPTFVGSKVCVIFWHRTVAVFVPASIRRSIQTPSESRQQPRRSRPESCVPPCGLRNRLGDV